MRLAVVGVGNAGSRVVNRVLDRERTSDRTLSGGNALLVNSKPPAFDGAEYVPEERRVTIGDVHGRVDGAGTGGDPDLGAEVARQERHEIVRAFDLIELHNVDGVLVVAGLAGGTGGGAGAVVLRRLQAICDEPVYAVGVLPAQSEGKRAALTAARSLQSFVAEADNVVAFDNDAWIDGPPDADDGDTEVGTDDGDDDPGSDGTGPSDEAFASANEILVERLLTLFATSEFDGETVAESRLDPSDMIRTLETGGLSSIGYASVDLPRTGGVRSWVRALYDRLPWTANREADPTDAATIKRLVRQAARSKLTLPGTVSSADRALVILSGPSRALSRKGFESGRYWLESEADVVDVRAGDEPDEGSRTLTAVVLFSNVTEVPRIDAMQERALDGERSAASNEADPAGSSDPAGPGDPADAPSPSDVPASAESGGSADPSGTSDSEGPGWDRFEAAEPR